MEAERASGELEEERRDLEAWGERLEGNKETLEREKAAVEGGSNTVFFAFAIAVVLLV